MLRNDVLWILVLAETGLIAREGPTSGEERIPEFLLQFSNLSFKICDKSRLFLESSPLDQTISAKVEFAQNLGRVRRVHDGGRGESLPDA
jgi:hypothetical protein